MIEEGEYPRYRQIEIMYTARDPFGCWAGCMTGDIAPVQYP
jgi:hypothetical protein